jgi:glucose-6-phosphate isomerase
MSDIAQALRAHTETKLASLKQLFANEPARVPRLSKRVGNLYFDWSKQRVDQLSSDLLLQLAEQRHVAEALQALFSGAPVNITEHRAALHWLLRADAALVPENLRAIKADMQQAHENMRSITNAVLAGRAADVGLVQPSAVINLGIGGSDLGPKLVFEALRDYQIAKHQTHFVANVDAHVLDYLLQRLDAKSTIFVVVSKSFKTEETLLNASLARAWLLANGVASADLSKHFLVVSSNIGAANQFGVSPDHVLPMSDTVGGRYSVWSAVGLATCMAIGWENFAALLDGARLVDQQTQHAKLSENAALQAALIGYFNGEYLAHATHAVICYDERLARLPDFLQQLEMESNGKGVNRAGVPLRHASAPVLWGGVGTNVQHAFFQAVHQGTQVIPVDFIGVIKPDHAHQQQHQVLQANLLAQSSALMAGKTLAQVQQSLPHLSAAEAQARVFPGNRPSTTILLDALTPSALGQLLSLYENKVYLQSILWDINAFDQWGVELGKVIASALLPALADISKAPSDTDQSTLALLAEMARLR